MTQLTVPAVIGTAAFMLALMLGLLRAKVQGRRLFLALTRRWVATSSRTPGLVLGLLCVIAVYSFALIAEQQGRAPGGATVLGAMASSQQTTDGTTNASAAADPDVQELRNYADTIDGKQPSAAASSTAQDSTALPDVDVMIAKLVARLEKEPNDVKGWKMLGWSYLNTGRSDDAATAYETALKLDPNDAEAKKALDQASAAKTQASATPPSSPEPSPSAEAVKAAEAQSAAERDSMIRGMVDRLATRLEQSPNDEDGWLRLMRSRMTLGEKDAAKAALAKALETFASDDAAKNRLAAVARELGVESN